VRLLRAEDGSALVTAMLVMALMLLMGIPALRYVEGQQQASGSQRASDSAFHLAEGVLETQAYLLSRRWPGSTATARPATCAAAAPVAGCPDPALVREGFQSPDWDRDATWTTAVRDNGGASASFFSDALVAGQPTWDANGDGKVWARAQAIARGRTRTIVALVQAETVDLSLAFPRNVITAGWTQTTNNGRKVIVDTQGDAGQPAPVAVRCTSREPACLGYAADKGQVAPDTTQTGFGAGAALTAERLDALRTRAIAAGTYTADGCPANPSGAIVFIERGTCSWTNSAGPCCNSAAAPGVLVVADGSVELGGNIEFHGVVYAVNQAQRTGPVVQVTGTAGVVGTIAVDGPGGVLAGSSAVNVRFSEHVFNRLYGYGSAGIIQNTWREIPG